MPNGAQSPDDIDALELRPRLHDQDLIVYERLLFEIHGPHGREIQLDVGPAALDLYDTIAARAKATLTERTGDEVWAPRMRSISPPSASSRARSFSGTTSRSSRP